MLQLQLSRPPQRNAAQKHRRVADIFCVQLVHRIIRLFERRGVGLFKLLKQLIIRLFEQLIIRLFKQFVVRLGRQFFGGWRKRQLVGN